MRTTRQLTGPAGALAALLATGLVLSACGSDDGSDAETGNNPDESTQGSESSADAFGHIHGLGAANGELYVATHFGLHTVADGEATMVSEDDHDFMGFTMADDDKLLASGHPNSRSDLPANLGLLESTDGGETWSDVSLSGEVDFHALDAKNGMIYGLDSGTAELMSSADGKEWKRLGQIAMADVTISPDAAKTVLITTEDGPQLSTNGGAGFETLGDAPVVMLADWPRPEELYGVGPAGEIHRSADGGKTWKPGADLGERPQALTVGPDGAVYVALEASIVVSTDDGQTFTDLYTWTPQ